MRAAWCGRNTFGHAEHLVTALANFTTSFFYPTLEQGGSREYDAAYLAVEQIDPAMTGRQWRYQQCSEVGWFQNAPAKDAVRSPKLDASYQRAACSRIFGRGVWPNVSAVNAHYGGASPKVTNVFFSHGGEDPWQHAGVVSDLGPTARARVAACDGCSHCVDLREVRADDPPELSRMREEISAHVASWLHLGAAAADAPPTAPPPAPPPARPRPRAMQQQEETPLGVPAPDDAAAAAASAAAPAPWALRAATAPWDVHTAGGAWSPWPALQP